MVSSVSPETEHTPAKAMTVSRDSPAAPVSDSSLLWRVPEGTASVPVGGGGARLLCPWATRPGRASRRRTEPHISDQAPPVWRAPVGPDGTAVVRRHGCAWPKGAWVRVRARVCATWALPAPLRPPTRRENQGPFRPKWRSGALSGVAVR